MPGQTGKPGRLYGKAGRNTGGQNRHQEADRLSSSLSLPSEQSLLRSGQLEGSFQKTCASDLTLRNVT